MAVVDIGPVGIGLVEIPLVVVAAFRYLVDLPGNMHLRRRHVEAGCMP